VPVDARRQKRTVGFAAHGADFRIDLVEAEGRWDGDAAVDGIGQGGVLFVIGLDYGGGRGGRRLAGAEGPSRPDYWIVGRDSGSGAWLSRPFSQ